MTPRTVDAALLADVRAELGEGPAWNAEREVLSYVDITAGLVHVCTADGDAIDTFATGRPVGAALPAVDGGFLLADADGFTLLDDDGTTHVLLAILADEPSLQFNDGKCDPRGRAWAGSLATDSTPGAGTLFRLDPGPRASPVLHGLTVSNGIGWSPDARTMWFVDSAEPFVRAFEYDVARGQIGEPREAIQIQATDCVPDGICVDDEGCVWVALWDGFAVHRYTPDGQLDTTVRVPAEKVTSCTFGGLDRSTLFITTARGGLSPATLRSQPTAGGLFTYRASVTGPAATPWSGSTVQ